MRASGAIPRYAVAGVGVGGGQGGVVAGDEAGHEGAVTVGVEVGEPGGLGLEREVGAVDDLVGAVEARDGRDAGVDHGDVDAGAGVAGVPPGGRPRQR